MAAYMLRASYDDEHQCVQIDHEKFVSGVGWAVKTDYVYTTPVGEWTELVFKDTDNVKYVDFLFTMTTRNLEVWRKLSMLMLHECQEEHLDLKAAAVDALETLDPTFHAPGFNLYCRWQTELLDHLIGPVATHVISTCTNKRRLKRFFFELQARMSQ
jgi:hypothetical protein